MWEIEGINKVRDELYTYGFEFSQIGPENRTKKKKSYQHNRKNILYYEIVLELVITYTNNWYVSIIDTSLTSSA